MGCDFALPLEDGGLESHKRLVRCHHMRVKLVVVHHRLLGTGNEDVQVDQLEVTQLWLVDFAHEYLVELLAALNDGPFEPVYDLHVVVADHGANQDPNNLGLFNLVNVGVPLVDEGARFLEWRDLRT